MKRFYIFVAVFLFIGGLVSVNAADMIILKDGSVIEAKIMEMHPNEIRYKRADNLNGPMVFLPKSGVLSIRYENGVVELINASPAATSPSAGQGSTQTGNAQTGGTVSSIGQQLGVPTSLQAILNNLPAIKIAGNNLKFQFGGDEWRALLNGENFWAGTLEIEDTNGGSILNLKQTHMWPGVATKKAGKLAGKFVGGAGGSALNTAGNLAGNAGAVEVSGPVIVLEYKAGPPAKLSYVRSTTVAAQSPENPDSISSGKRYEVVEKGMSWANAKKEAEKRGGYLAVINDAEEQKMIEDMISTGKNGSYWLGGFLGRAWNWVNDEPMSYTNWGPGQPRTGSDSGYHRWMIMMRVPWMGGAKLGQWAVTMKDSKNGFIIEWD